MMECRQWAKEDSEKFARKCAEIFRDCANRQLREVMPDVLRPIPPAWSSKPRTYGAYKRMMIRRIGA